MALTYDMLINQEDLVQAQADMLELLRRAEALKTKLNDMYDSLNDALDTPTGKEMKLEGKYAILEPIDNLVVVLRQVYLTLVKVNGRGFYEDVFIEFEALNNSINFN